MCRCGGAAKSGAFADETELTGVNFIVDNDLAEIVVAWPRLSGGVKAAILRLLS
jgi:hypothetical protein